MLHVIKKTRRGTVVKGQVDGPWSFKWRSVRLQSREIVYLWTLPPTRGLQIIYQYSIWICIQSRAGLVFYVGIY